MTSPSTLIRKARKAKTRAEAVRLRAQAAKLRRETRRLAKAAKTTPQLARAAGDPNVKSRHQIYPAFKEALLNGGTVSPNGGGTVILSVGSEEQGVQAKSPVDEAVDDIFRVTRDKKLNNSALPVITVRRHLVEAKARGREEADKDARRRADMAREMTKVAVVSGFIAHANLMAKINGGPMPQVVTMNGFTLARVLDALSDAGWSEDGKTSMGRRQADLDMVLGTRHGG